MTITRYKHLRSGRFTTKILADNAQAATSLTCGMSRTRYESFGFENLAAGDADAVHNIRISMSEAEARRLVSGLQRYLDELTPAEQPAAAH